MTSVFARGASCCAGLLLLMVVLPRPGVAVSPKVSPPELLVQARTQAGGSEIIVLVTQAGVPVSNLGADTAGGLPPGWTVDFFESCRHTNRPTAPPFAPFDIAGFTNTGSGKYRIGLDAVLLIPGVDICPSGPAGFAVTITNANDVPGVGAGLGVVPY